jgi:predicted peroxiredoxin/TusA-related sulfurtransferase
MASSTAATVDVRDTWKSCKAVYEIHKALQGVEPTSTIEVITNHEGGISKDISTWCEARGHQMVSSGPLEGHEKDMRLVIRRGETPGTTQKSMTVIITTADLEHVVYPLDKALAGALLGMGVNIVFEGAGVRLLKRGYRAKLSGVIGALFTPMVERAMKRDIGWPIPAETLRILEGLGAHFYICGPSMIGYKVREEDIVLSNYTVGATITWADLMARSDIHILSKAQFEKP